MMVEKLAPPETLMAMGRLMGQLETREMQEREAFHAHFKRFSRPKNQKRFRVLFGTGGRESPRGVTQGRRS
ncbi:hypothetical protein ACFL3S_13650 [Gemmatimonadota bacterium]